MLTAAGFNFKRMMKKWKSSFWLFLEKVILFLNRQFDPIRTGIIVQTREKWIFYGSTS
jgi:IS5 family transposase